MDRSMRMVLIGGVLMLALLIAVIGSVSADSPAWHFAGHTSQLPDTRSL
jgi:hypothetical protein